MINILKNEILSFVVIAFVIVLLAVMSRRIEHKYKKFDKNEKNEQDK